MKARSTMRRMVADTIALRGNLKWVDRMWLHNQPLDPSEVAPELVERLRDLWRQGKSTADLVRALHDLGMGPVPIKICFQAAFHLEDYGDVMPIGGWFPNGGGELSEDQLHRLMAPRIEGARQAWDHPAATAERLQQTR